MNYIALDAAGEILGLFISNEPDYATNLQSANPHFASVHETSYQGDLTGKLYDPLADTVSDDPDYVPPPPLESPPPQIPQIVTRAQFKLALLDLDLLDDVEALVAGTTDRALKINWAERLEFERDHPLVIATAAALGKTEAEIDALFVLAATK